MSNQSYDTSALKNKAGDVRTQNAELRSMINQLEDLLNEMKGVWKDSAQTKFAQQFANMRPELDSFCKSIDSFAERAEQHATTVEQAEDVL